MKRTVRRVTTISATVLALVAVGMPANAATGNGNSVGTYFIDSTGINFPPPCSVVYNYTYASGPGYTGTYTDGIRTYNGPLTVTMTARQDITYLGQPAVGFEGPEGIYDDPQCTIPDANGWRAKATVLGSNAGNTVSCTYNTGTVTRRASQVTEWDMQGDCKINNGASSKTREVHVGQLGECRQTDLDAPPEKCDETNTWVATNR